MYKYIVYKTTNIKNNFIYIGVHRTNIDYDDGYIGCGVYSTSKSHKKLKGTKFRRAVAKYGPKSFVREILFTYDDTLEGKIQAYKKEAELVNRDFLKRKDVYNMTLGGKVPSSILEKEIAQYTMGGEFIKTYHSITHAAQVTGFSDSGIQAACSGTAKYSNDYQWKYFTGDKSDIPPIKGSKKVVYQFDLQGNYITYYKSLHEATEKTGVDYRSISQVCLGKCGQAGGFYWSYKKHFDFDPKKVQKVAVACYNDAGEFIKSYSSITEAAKEHNVGVPTLSICISGKRKHCAKLRWRYFYGNTSNISPLKD